MPSDLNPVGRVIHVEQNGGNDDNDGLSIEQAFATVSRGAQALQPGDILLVGPGTYYERVSVQVPGTSAENPVWIRSRCLGDATISGMWRDAAEGETQWEDEGGGIYSAAYNIAPTYGAFEGTLLFRHMLEEELRSSRLAIHLEPIRNRYQIDEVNLPPYGFSYDYGPDGVVNRRYPTGRVLVRLPGNANPNGRRVLLSRAGRNEFGNEEIITGQTTTSHSRWFSNRRLGRFCIDTNATSHDMTVRNVQFAYCTSGIRMTDNALVEWSEFSIPGLSEFIDQIRCLNDDGERKFFTLVKGHHFVDSPIDKQAK